MNDEVIKYLGGLAAAAKFDCDIADPADVTMDGMPVSGWRKAYLEGVKDTIEGIITRQPDLEAPVKEALAKRFLHRGFQIR